MTSIAAPEGAIEMTPNKKNYSGKLEKDKNVDEIMAEMDSCNRKILENVTEIGVEASKINFILGELKKLFQGS